MNKIIAIVGMNGSGKTTVSDIIVAKGYEKIYFGGVTKEKLKEKNLEITPENEKMMCEKLREDLGMGAFATILLPKIKKIAEEKNLVLDGVYSWEEYQILTEELGKKLVTICVVADKFKRYERLEKKLDEPLTKKEAIKRDLSEIENAAKAPPIAYADYYILNNNSMEELQKRVERLIANI